MTKRTDFDSKAGVLVVSGSGASTGDRKQCTKCGRKLVLNDRLVCFHCEDTSPGSRAPTPPPDLNTVTHFCERWDCQNKVERPHQLCDDCDGKTRPNSMTREAFMKRYASLSGVTVAWVEKRMVARECRCGELGCRGWRMDTRDHVAEERAMEARRKLDETARQLAEGKTKK